MKITDVEKLVAKGTKAATISSCHKSLCRILFFFLVLINSFEVLRVCVCACMLVRMPAKIKDSVRSPSLRVTGGH